MAGGSTAATTTNTGSFIILLPIKIVYLSGGVIHHVQDATRRPPHSATLTLIESTPPTNTLTELVS